MKGADLLLEIWQRKSLGLAGLFLYPAACLYEAAVRLRNYLYDQKLLPIYRLPCPIISVGNLSVGGTGKTPMTIFLTNMIREAGFRPVIVSRGYKGRGEKGVSVVSTEREMLLPPQVSGDEPFLMAQKLPGVPVVIGGDRVKAGKLAIEKFFPDCLVCDDAFQHRRLYRDLDVLLLDAARPFGNGRLLPAGPLREPKESVQRAHLVILTRKGGETPSPHVSSSFTARLEASAFFFPGTGELKPPAALQGKKILAFAGIAAPKYFLQMLKETGAQVEHFLAFPDHYRYQDRDLENIKQVAAQTDCEIICTTEKDAVKVIPQGGELGHLAVLQVEMKIEEGADTLSRQILDVIGTWKRRGQ
ncbi:MAG TPA: tetraacyldisaccharide 4'-kinase [Syntrophales bacterium]|nr:tetraacyldisaccharide 4'-kinase [Syntrophales bacterium]HOL59342.1 tetraacyldisaccharide 4'-kinase [Syntrophales bacterium]HPO35466.1 tetraacyldisaccharide 4'-kinase [Syntrophales bacterium]